MLEKFFQKKLELSNLLDKKISLINKLVSAEKEMLALTPPENQEYISLFLVEFTGNLPKNKRKNIIGDLNRKMSLIKSCDKTLDELDELDTQVKIALLDIVIEKIKYTLGSK